MYFREKSVRCSDGESFRSFSWFPVFKGGFFEVVAERALNGLYTFQSHLKVDVVGPNEADRLSEMFDLPFARIHSG